MKKSSPPICEAKFPPPSSISPQAQAALLSVRTVETTYPALHDRAAWLEAIRNYNQLYSSLFEERVKDLPPVKREVVAGTSVIRIDYDSQSSENRDRVFLDIHGGGLIYFGGQYMDWLARMSAASVKMNVISVDYRMPPEHPFPAGLDDCLSVYRTLVNERGAENIIVGGSSAGGNLALALMLRLKEEGLPLPAGLVLLSPEIDLTESGDSFQVLAGLDRITSMAVVNKLYAAGVPLDHPHVSPLFGDFSGGFPKTFIQAGTRDLLLSNAVRLHRALRRVNADAELHLWEAMPHGKFFDAPEDDEVDEEVRKFIKGCWV
jgi:epsilon-lactone hydrolase